MKGTRWRAHLRGGVRQLRSWWRRGRQHQGGRGLVLARAVIAGGVYDREAFVGQAPGLVDGHGDQRRGLGLKAVPRRDRGVVEGLRSQG